MYIVQSIVVSAVMAMSASEHAISATTQDSVKNTSVVAEWRWNIIESLMTDWVKMPIGFDSLTVSRYKLVNNARVNLLRDAGAYFSEQHPSDPRICRWLKAAAAANVFTRGVQMDSTRVTVLAWEAKLPELRRRCITSSAPYEERLAGAYESSIQQLLGARQTLSQGGAVDWDVMQRTVLDYGDRFSNDSNVYHVDALSKVLHDLYKRYNPNEESLYLTSLRASRNPFLQQLGASQAALAEARRVPSFLFREKTLDGRIVDMTQLRGKVVLLDYWFLGCTPCHMQEPFMKVVYEKYHDKGFEIIGIAVEDGEERRTLVNQYVLKHKIPWPQIFDSTGMAGNHDFRRFGFDGAPVMLLLDKEGLLVEVEARGAKLEELVKKYL